MLAIISGIDLGFISKDEGINILEKIIESIDSLEKWNGHLYNWYNIKTKEPQLLSADRKLSQIISIK